MTGNSNTISFGHRGRVVIGTGGAQGIGEACARRFAREGAKVVIADLDAKRGPSLAGELGATFVACDVGDRSQVEALVAATVQQHGRIDILVDNAGILRAACCAGQRRGARQGDEPHPDEAPGRAVRDCRRGRLAGQRCRQLRHRGDRGRRWRTHAAQLHGNGLRVRRRRHTMQANCRGNDWRQMSLARIGRPGLSCPWRGHAAP